MSRLGHSKGNKGIGNRARQVSSVMLRGQLRSAAMAVKAETDVELIDPDGVSGWWIDCLSDEARTGLEAWLLRREDEVK